MAHQTHYLQLAPDETAAQIIQRLAPLPRGARALFILPPDAPPLRERLELTLVLRAASRNAIQIALVSEDPRVLYQAAALRVSVFDTVGAAEGKRWKRGRSRIFSSRDARESAEVATSLRPISADPATAIAPLARLRRFLLQVLATLLLLALPIAAAAFFLPSAQITLTPRLYTLEQELSLRADASLRDIDFEGGAIPVTQFVVQTQRSASRPSSGSTVLPQSLASGVVTFTNRTTRELFIPAGTALATSELEPQRFRTTAAALVPAGFGETVDVTIEAQQASAGKRGNLPAGAINVVAPPFADSVRVVNAEVTGGGRDATYPLVTAADFAALRAQLEGELIVLAYEEMAARLDPGQTIILQTLKIPAERQQVEWAAYSAAIGEIVAEVRLSLTAEVVALAYRQSDIQQVALARLSAARGNDQLFLPDRTQFDCCQITAVHHDGSVTLLLEASAQYAPDLPVDDYRAPLAGRSLADAKNWLAENTPLAEEAPPQLNISPRWFGRIPFWAERISITTTLPRAP